MIGKSLRVSNGMLTPEPEELLAIFRNMVSISLELARFSGTDSWSLPRNRVNRPSSPRCNACSESFDDYQATNQEWVECITYQIRSYFEPTIWRYRSPQTLLTVTKYCYYPSPLTLFSNEMDSQILIRWHAFPNFWRSFYRMRDRLNRILFC